MTLDGTVALVTGGAKRVGRAIVLELARAGCDVAIHHRHSPAEAEDLGREVVGLGRRALPIAGDLSDPATWPVIVRQTVDRLGRLDILVNNASQFLTGHPDTVDGFDSRRWEAMLRTNLVAPMALCHHARLHLAKHGCGRIVNLCDSAADRPWPEHLAYCASKAAVDRLTECVQLEESAHGLRA